MTNNEFDKLVLNSSFDKIERLEPYLKNIQQEIGFNDEQFDRIRLAVNEAITNAIVHGNDEDPSKKVYLSVSQYDGMLQISVQDEGPGFDPSSLPDPLEDENLLKESGRGIFLIKQYADEVEFSDNGTRLTMKFTLSHH